MYPVPGLELEVKRGTAKIAVEGLVTRRAPRHFQQVWKGTTANLLLQGGAPRHLQFEGWVGLSGGFTPCRQLRPSSGREHTTVTYSVR